MLVLAVTGVRYKAGSIIMYLTYIPIGKSRRLSSTHSMSHISISNYIHYNVWDEITYAFLNFNGATVEV